MRKTVTTFIMAALCLMLGLSTASCHRQNTSENTETEDPNDEMCIGSFHYSDLASRCLNENEIINFQPSQLKLLRNEFYARHGMIFNEAECDNFFRTKSWYTPQHDVSQAGFITDQLFSPAEKANVITIRCLERRMNFGEYMRKGDVKDLKHMVADECSMHSIYGNDKLSKEECAELIVDCAAKNSSIDLNSWVKSGDCWYVSWNPDCFDDFNFTVYLDSEGAISAIGYNF